MNSQTRAFSAALVATALLVPLLTCMARADTIIEIADSYFTGKQFTKVSADGKTTTVVKELNGINPATGNHEQKTITEITKVNALGKKLSVEHSETYTIWKENSFTKLTSYNIKATDTYDASGGVSRDETVTHVDHDTGIVFESHTTGKLNAGFDKYKFNDTLYLWAFAKGAEATDTTKKPGEQPVVKKYKRTGLEWSEISSGLPAPSSLIAITPSSNAATVADEQAYLPSTASSQVMATFVDPSSSGPSGQVTVGFVQADNTTKYFHTHTDSAHHLLLNVLNGTKMLLLFKGFTRDGKPDDGVVSTEITRNAASFSHVAERGGPIDLPGQNLDPTSARATMDGSTQNIQTVAASDNSVRAIVGQGASLGRHRFAINAGTAMPGDVITLMADPLPNSEPGRIETVTVHVEGLPPGDSATMEFAVSGAAQLASGGSATVVTVRDGLAQVRIIGRHAGQAIVHFHLTVQLAA